MAIQFVGASVVRGLIAGVLKEEAKVSAVNNLDIKVKVTPKNPLIILPKKRKEMQARERKALSIVAQTGINIILDRTEEGIGVNGPFKSYTPQYEAFRVESGRGATPDLMFTTRMLGSMTSQVKGNTAIIFFSGAEQQKKAAFNNQTRRFMSFTKNEQRRLGNVFKKYYL